MEKVKQYKIICLICALVAFASLFMPVLEFFVSVSVFDLLDMYSGESEATFCYAIIIATVLTALFYFLARNNKSYLWAGLLTAIVGAICLYTALSEDTDYLEVGFYCYEASMFISAFFAVIAYYAEINLEEENIEYCDFTDTKDEKSEDKKENIIVIRQTDRSVDFRSDLKKISSPDLKLILENQKDRFSKIELAIIEEELKSRCVTYETE